MCTDRHNNEHVYVRLCAGVCVHKYMRMHIVDVYCHQLLKGPGITVKLKY